MVLLSNYDLNVTSFTHVITLV